MSRPKLYFRNEDSEECYTLDWHLEDARDEELEKIELFEAIPDKDKRYFYCRSFSEVCEVGQDFEPCGNGCDGYEPRNGKFGICKHKTHCHTWGEKINFDVKTGRIIPKISTNNERINK